jgi:hypothetical protein
LQNWFKEFTEDEEILEDIRKYHRINATKGEYSAFPFDSL